MADILTRDVLQTSDIIQDVDAVSRPMDGEGNTLSAVEPGTNQTVGRIVGEIYGLLKLLGEQNRRHGAKRITGDNISLTGQITSVATTVTGTGTDFINELEPGDFIAVHGVDEFREVQAIGGPGSLSLVSAFSSDVGVASDFIRLQKVAERLDAILPIGTVLSYAGDGLTIPKGCLRCDGSSFSRTVYADLFNIIGTTYGPGDGLTTANLPNFDGIFLRGEGSQSVSGRLKQSLAQGVIQEDTFQGHGWFFGGYGSGGYTASGAGKFVPDIDSISGPLTIAVDSGFGAPRQGQETKPVNSAVIYIIKAVL